ncbi:MAG: GFA family protein [Sphingopyxis sp.]|uniref:GFA family protein n=1 Tax=Sphingopyxis sp. TaxID=1908224 RepID=UPI001A1F4C89|nr:GFA family protein [Sphingopyxis sp.]
MGQDAIDGGCLCGAIQFRITGTLGDVRLCHCDLCRRANGSAFSANCRVLVSDFRVIRQAALISEYQSSPGAWKCFCSICGSPVYSRVEWDAEFIRVRLGTLPRDTQVRVVAHVWTGSKAAWDHIVDDLPQFEQGAE